MTKTDGKPNSLRVTKSKQQGSWSLAHFETVQEALNWIAPCIRYCIIDTTSDPEKVVDMQRWDFVNDRGIWEKEPDPKEEAKIERVIN